MDHKDSYLEFLQKHIEVRSPLTAVFDASNGPTGMLIKNLFANTLINSIIINDEVDPDFGAHGPNPLVLGATDHCQKVIGENKADIGVIFDADGDRALFLDDRGEVLPACFVASLLFANPDNSHVADELVYQSLRMLGLVNEGSVSPSRIGSRFVKEIMREKGSHFGAEYSGHYYFKDFFNADSGIFASIVVLNTLHKMDKKLSEWRSVYGEYKSVAKEIGLDGKDIQNIYLDLEKRFAESVQRIDKRDGLTLVFDDHWVNIRPSNTEPIMRIIAEGRGQVAERVAEIDGLI